MGEGESGIGEENREGSSSVEKEVNFLALNSKGYLGLLGGNDSVGA